MEQHPQLTEQRVRNFVRRAIRDIYAQRQPLTVQYTHDIDPIPFSSLKDREWKAIEVGSRWGGEWESAWFRFEGTIPPAWKNEEVHFLVDTGSEACVFDKNGAPVCGLTSAEGSNNPLQRKGLVPITKKAKGGEKVDLLVEAAANRLFGYTRDCRLVEACLVLFRRDLWDFVHDFGFLVSLMDALPEDHPRRARIRYALNAAVNRYGAGSHEEVAQSREAIQKELKKPANASADRVSAIGHAHIDVAWLWPLRETVRKVGRTFSTALRYMEEYPDYKFGASQAQLYAFAKEHYPALYERIRQAIQEKRWEVQGAMWVEADCNVTGGESLVRQVLYGKRFFKEEFGVDVDNLWLPDVFGYSAALPQILKKAGVHYFLTQKISWNQFNKFPHHTFLWEGIDGTRIFSHFPPADTYNGDFSAGQMIYASRNFAEKDRTDCWMYLYGWGDGGGGPSRHQIEFGLRMKSCEELPKVEFEFARDFFKKAEASIDDLPVWRGELYLELHRGTLTTQARNKRMNRKAELALRDAEMLAALTPHTYPAEEFRRLWQIVLTNQFHDIIPGSSITWVYKDSLRQYQEVLEAVARIRENALAQLASQVNTSGTGRPILLCNTLSWNREALVLLPSNGEDCVVLSDSGEVCPMQAVAESDYVLARVNVPSMGYRVVFVREGETAEMRSDLAVSETLIENDLLRVEFAQDGRVQRIFDKEAGREVLAEGELGNTLALYEDIPNNWDAWDVDIFYEERPPELPKLESVDVLEAGPLRARIRHTYSISRSKIVQEVVLTAGSKRLEFHTKVDWREEHRMLRTSFPVNVSSEAATYEIQYGHLQRPTHRNTSWDMARFEVAAHKWVDLSEPNYGVALLNDCKYGHKVHRNVLDLNLLRSTREPDPEADIGEHEFSYALLPHQGGFREAGVIREAYEFNVPCMVHEMEGGVGTLPKVQSFLQVSAPNVVVECVKGAEDEPAVIVRLYEAFGQHGDAEITVPTDVKRVATCNLLEEDEGEVPLCNETIRLHFKPFEILTLKLYV